MYSLGLLPMEIELGFSLPTLTKSQSRAVPPAERLRMLKVPAHCSKHFSLFSERKAENVFHLHIGNEWRSS
jgi:hypothetical protein